MRDSEHPDMFPMQERKAVDVYALRVARNSVLSDIAAVGAASALTAGADGVPVEAGDGGVPDDAPAVDGAVDAPVVDGVVDGAVDWAVDGKGVEESDG
jgi:hypothetical protein